MEKYYEIYNDISQTINLKNRNYEILNNIIEIKNNDIIKDINVILKKENNNKIKDIIEIYNKMTINNNNEITLIYKINEIEDIIKLFDSQFVNNNKNNCKIIYENKEYELQEKFKFNNHHDKETIEIKLKGIKNITNLNNIFFGCNSLLSSPDIYKLGFSNINEMNNMFS